MSTRCRPSALATATSPPRGRGPPPFSSPSSCAPPSRLPPCVLVTFCVGWCRTYAVVRMQLAHAWPSQKQPDKSGTLLVVILRHQLAILAALLLPPRCLPCGRKVCAALPPRSTQWLFLSVMRWHTVQSPSSHALCAHLKVHLLSIDAQRTPRIMFSCRQAFLKALATPALRYLRNIA